MPFLRRLSTLLPLLVLGALALGASSARAAAPGLNLSNVPGDPATESRAFAEAAELHAGWVRMFMGWDLLEKSPGAYDQATLDKWDETIDRARANGMKVDLVLFHAPSWASGSSDESAPPRDPAEFASFARTVASHFAGRVAAYEIWNEEDEGEFWTGGDKGASAPAYTRLLQAAYPAIKVADPSATVLVGGLVGNNYGYVDDLYANGAKGSFDGVAVHTDIACNLASPNDAYRDVATGRISRWSFTGYREVRQSMLDHGDDKPIWMTELGWSTTKKTCDSGASAGKKDGGVSEATQAKYLTEAYRCLAQDSYVPVGMWFNLEDAGAVDASRFRFGLVRPDLSHKPAYDAFAGVTGAASASGGACGARIDNTPPKLDVIRPTPNAIFVADLPVEATASDDQELRRIELFVDGKKIRNFDHTGTASMDYQGAKDLPLGDHTVTFKAHDAANHTTTVNVPVKKVDAADLGPFKTTTTAKLRTHRRSRRVRIAGRVLSEGVAIRIPGKAHIVFQKRSHGHWKTAHKYDRNASETFRFAVKLERARWRMRVTYRGEKPFRSSRARTVRFSVPAAHTATYPRSHRRTHESRRRHRRHHRRHHGRHRHHRGHHHRRHHRRG